MLHLLTRYKETEAVLAALEMRLFEQLEKGCSLHALASKGEWDESRLVIFLQYLQHLRLVREEAGDWKLTVPFAKEWLNAKLIAPFVAWETYLQSGWVTASGIVAALRQGPRKFDQIGFRKDEQALYAEAMYGDSVRPIGLQLNRLLRGKESVRILEVGRSLGVLMEQLERFQNISQGTIMVVPVFLELAQSQIEALLQKERFQLLSINETEHLESCDLICLMNTIHYWMPEEAQQYITRFREILDTGGKLVIIDLFLNEKQFEKSVLLDWLTHGGCNLLTVAEVIEQLRCAGFCDFQWKKIPGSEWECIIAG